MRLAWLSCILVWSACSSTNKDPVKEYSALQEVLDQNKSLWAIKSITHYRFDFILSAYSLNAGILYTIEVDQNQVVSIVVKETQESINPMVFPWIKTFAGNFETIQDAISANANSIKVTYNKDFGFVETYAIDYAANIADDEIGISVSNFELL